MKYFEEIDAWLTAVLLGGEEGEKSEQWLLRVKKEIKDKIWLSYQNGQKSTRKPKPTQSDKPKPKTKPKTDDDPFRAWEKRKHEQETGTLGNGQKDEPEKPREPKWEPKWADSEEQAIADLKERERKYRELHGS